MKKNLCTFVILWATIATAACILSVCSTSCTSAQALDSLTIYDQYYHATEKLLSEIEDYHDWSTQYADMGREEDFDYYEIKWELNHYGFMHEGEEITPAKRYELLHMYYVDTQKLLTMLENDYGWLDTVGESDLYCEWCNINKQLNNAKDYGHY